MLRLTLLLCAGLYGALMVAGADNGQLRPGLANAAQEARLPSVSVADAAQEPAVPVVAALAEEKPVAQEKLVVEVSYAPKAAVPEAAVSEATAPETATLTASSEPPTLPVPVFSLSALQSTLAVEDQTPQPEVATGGGTIWYVTASSVNVRSGPTTDSEVVGKLVQGEATLVVRQEGDEWARIVIQGDGVEGFVAARFLSPTEP